MKVLVTNDDGIESRGLGVLVRSLVAAGHEVLVAAPDREMSGAAASMGPLPAPGRVDFERRVLDGLEVEAYAVHAPPAICVISSLLGGFGDPPDVVASGINAGLNTGRSVLHSGTVGAALTAAAWGSAGVAVSMSLGPSMHWETAGTLAAHAVGWLSTVGSGHAVSVNVPDAAIGDLAGVTWADPAPLGSVRTEIAARHERHLELNVVDMAEVAPEGTDTELVAAGYATVTLVDGPCPSPAIEARASLAEAMRWWL